MRSGIWINTKAATLPKHVTVLVWSLEGRWPPSELGQNSESSEQTCWPSRGGLLGSGPHSLPYLFSLPPCFRLCSPPRTQPTSSTACPSDTGGGPLKWQTVHPHACFPASLRSN